MLQAPRRTRKRRRPWLAILGFGVATLAVAVVLALLALA